LWHLLNLSLFLQNGVVLNSTDTAVRLMNLKASRQLEIKTLVTVAFKGFSKGNKVTHCLHAVLQIMSQLVLLGAKAAVRIIRANRVMTIEH